MDRRDWLAQLLTDDDVETLKHLAREGMGENSLRALASDLAYLETWADAATGQPLSWPATEALALKFVAHHLWDPAKRVSDPATWDARGRRRELASGGVAALRGPACPKHRQAAPGELEHTAPWKGIEGPFARRACARPCAWPFAPRRGRASARASGPSPGMSWIG